MFARISSIVLAGILLVALAGVFQAAAQTEANKALVERVRELWNTGDLAIADEIFAPDFVNYNPNHPDVTNLESVKAQIVEIRTAFPDFHVTTDDIIAEGDKVAGRWTIISTHEPTGKQVRVTGMEINRFADGKIVESWWIYDRLGMLEQLGVIPPTREDYTWGVPSDVTGDPGTPEENKELVQHLREVGNSQNWAVLDEIVATNVVLHSPSTGDIIGIEGYRQFLTVYFTAFPDLQFTIEDQVAEGDKVALRYASTGTHEGELMGIPPTGVHVTTPHMLIYRFADGRIVEIWFVADSLGMLQQLGVIPPLEPTQAVESSTWGQVKSLFK